jgi:NitT/TauT family transport system substrate-binding protein
MRKRKWYVLAAALAVGASLVVAGFAAAAQSSQQLTKVTIQLKWVTQSQFAGYYAAKSKGFYKAVGLDVNLKVGGPDVVNEQTVLSKQAEFGINWFPSLLQNRDTGNDLVNIAQVYARSGTTEVTFKKSGIDTFKKMRGKKFGVWIFGNEFEQRAALVKYGMNPDKDVQLVKQDFTMVPFINGEVDASSAMTYNELAQVLETKNPDTGKLYTLKDLNVFKYSDLGTGMLQDGIFVRGDWINDTKNQATAVKFLQATIKGWIYCRDH